LALQTYINKSDTITTQFQLPEHLPKFDINLEAALSSAKQNLPDYMSFQRKSLEIKKKSAEAKSQGRQVNLLASYGLNSSATDISGIYRNPQNQQRFGINFMFPIADWGKRRNDIALAKIAEDDIEIKNKLDESKLKIEITNLINDLPIYERDVTLSLLLDTLSQKRFYITNRRFQLDKASLLELQNAQIEKDNARTNYISSLRRFWELFYLLRAKTGIEFQNN
jgi:outer membrane protein TolC